MTIFDKIEVKLTWFAWAFKLPVFALLVCVWVITRPYEWLYFWATTRNATEANAFYKRTIRLQEKAFTEKLVDLINIFH